MTNDGLVACQIERAGGDFLGLARPIEQMPRSVDDARPFLAAGARTRSLGQDKARRDGIGADVVGGVVHGEDAGEMNERRLGGAVGRARRHAEMTELRGDVDDAAAARTAQLRHRELAHQESAGEIDRNRLVPLFEAQRLHRAIGRRCRRHVHQRGEFAERLDRAGNCVLGACLIGHIGTEAPRPASGIDDRAGHALRLVRFEVRNCNFSALAPRTSGRSRRRSRRRRR